MKPMREIKNDNNILACAPKNGTYISGHKAILHVAKASNKTLSRAELISQADAFCEENLFRDMFGTTIGEHRFNFLKTNKYITARGRVTAKGRQTKLVVADLPSGIAANSYCGHLGDNQVVLVIDTREGGNNDDRLRRIHEIANQLQIPHFTHSLPTGLGDYTLVYRKHEKHYWLGFILERKAQDDLGSQKYNLKYLISLRITTSHVKMTDVLRIKSNVKITRLT